MLSRKAVEKEKLKMEAEQSISMKYNYRETILAFLLKTYLEMRRKKMKKQEEDVSGFEIPKHDYKAWRNK